MDTRYVKVNATQFIQMSLELDQYFKSAAVSKSFDGDQAIVAHRLRLTIICGSQHSSVGAEGRNPS